MPVSSFNNCNPSQIDCAAATEPPSLQIRINRAAIPRLRHSTRRNAMNTAKAVLSEMRPVILITAIAGAGEENNIRRALQKEIGMVYLFLKQNKYK
ncbi:hypothetical protein HSX11_09585 [Oxalobacteraceae bacterium]|nr:hypothetical protein [Oxalobacteraceae bacterium]